MSEREVMSVTEAARFLRRRTQDVLDDVAAGRIPHVRLGRHTRVPRSTLLRLIGEGRIVVVEERAAEPVKEYKPGRYGIPLTVRFAVLRRCGYACSYCGRRAPDVELQVDHVVPVLKGGLNHPDNLTAACRDCNLGKRAEDAHLEGFGGT